MKNILLINTGGTFSSRPGEHGLVPELVSERLMASIPFAGRYRMVDFILSSMVNCGIDNVSIIVRKNYHSLMDHLGSGREWDLARKNGGLNIVPPFAEKTVKIYNGRVEALASIVDFLRDQKEKYVVMSDANIAVNFDFKAFMDAHIASGADVTVAYSESELPAGAMKKNDIGTNMYYSFGIEDGRSRTLEEVGKEFNVTRERIRQIEAKALRKLRHPSRSKKLKDFLS